MINKLINNGCLGLTSIFIAILALAGCVAVKGEFETMPIVPLDTVPKSIGVKIPLNIGHDVTPQLPISTPEVEVVEQVETESLGN